MERSFVMVKPDGVQRGLIGEVISRLERRGLRLVAASFVLLARAGRNALCRPPGQALLSRLDRLHHLRPGDGDGLGRAKRGRRRPPDDGLHPPHRSCTGHPAPRFRP